MSLLDFEEFLWACISEVVIDELKQHLDEATPVPRAPHKRLRGLVLQYAVVRGLQKAVQTFLDTKLTDRVLIVRSYEDDMVKYTPEPTRPTTGSTFILISN